MRLYFTELHHFTFFFNQITQLFQITLFPWVDHTSSFCSILRNNYFSWFINIICTKFYFSLPWGILLTEFTALRFTLWGLLRRNNRKKLGRWRGMSPGLVAEELSSKLVSGFLKASCDTLRVVVRFPGPISLSSKYWMCVFVCVCVWERERERERGTQREIRYSLRSFWALILSG